MIAQPQTPFPRSHPPLGLAPPATAQAIIAQSSVQELTQEPPSDVQHPAHPTLRSIPAPPAYTLPPLEGSIQVFTSRHRNFFTNVMAEALRHAGQGQPVLIVQFLKGGSGQGPKSPVRLGQQLDWLRCALPYCLDAPPNPADPERATQEQAAVRDLWTYTTTMVNHGDYDVVILDEISLAIEFGFLDEAEVLRFLQERPAAVDILLMGPAMPPGLLAIADQITELRHSPERTP